jgi:hypothetical protein
MAEADYSPVTAQVPNRILDKIVDYGRKKKIMKRVRLHGSSGAQTADSVNISATVCVILEEFFELMAQKAA